MKVVNERLELVDYEESEKSEERKEKRSIKPYTLLIRMQLIDLVYDMNNDIHHKMNAYIIGFQLFIFTLNLLLPRLFNISTIPVSVATAVVSVGMLFLVLMGNVLSDKAIKKSRVHQKVINDCIKKITEEFDEEDEYTE